MEKMAINPFHVGSGFVNYCVKQGWIILEPIGEDKRLHYFVTETGKEQLLKLYDISFDCPCAKEPDGFVDSL